MNDLIVAVSLVTTFYVALFGAALLARKLYLAKRIGPGAAMLTILSPVWVGFLLAGFAFGWNVKYAAALALVFGVVAAILRRRLPLMREQAAVTIPPAPRESRVELAMVVAFMAVPGYILLVVLALFMLHARA
jgi:hypothetical protein